MHDTASDSASNGATPRYRPIAPARDSNAAIYYTTKYLSGNVRSAQRPGVPSYSSKCGVCNHRPALRP